MNSFGYIFFSVFGTITISAQLYYIIKNGINKNDFTNNNVKNMELKYGIISLFYLVLEIICLLIYFYL